MNVGNCKHFNGTMNDECDKGVEYKTLAGEPEFGLVKRLPCLSKYRVESIVFCDYFRPLSQIEVNEAEQKREKSIQDKLIAVGLILKEHPEIDPQWEGQMDDRKGFRGTIECPVCKGILHYTIAGGNHHIWGKCETEDCLSWMM